MIWWSDTAEESRVWGLLAFPASDAAPLGQKPLRKKVRVIWLSSTCEARRRYGSDIRTRMSSPNWSVGARPASRSRRPLLAWIPDDRRDLLALVLFAGDEKRLQFCLWSRPSDAKFLKTDPFFFFGGGGGPVIGRGAESLPRHSLFGLFGFRF